MAKDDLFSFILYNNLDYQPNWHHREICRIVTDFMKSDDTRLMLFVPPQHGKSEITSRNLPAWAFGRNPDLKIAGCSYSASIAKTFNRAVKRIIENGFYNDVFPHVRLNSKNTVTDDTRGYLRNTEEFEIVGYKGAYKAVGVQGGLSSYRVDLAIIDDPIKDLLEASSPVYRDRVFEWYSSVLEARLHNRSKVIIIMTRWHEDDLAGRLLEKEGDKWRVIRIAAIKQDNEPPLNKDGKLPEPVNDPRSPGEALWPERHSLEKLLDTRALSPSIFESINQQNPGDPEGNKVKKAWFQFCDFEEVPAGLIWDAWIDGAYTKNRDNSPTGIVISAYDRRRNRIYIRHAVSRWLEMPELLKFVPNYCHRHGLNRRSRIRIEPKANGLTLIRMLNDLPDAPPAVKITGPLVSEGKEGRLSVASPKIESGQLLLVRGEWNDEYIHQISQFPKVKDTEFVDLTGYLCDYYDRQKKKGGVKRRN